MCFNFHIGADRKFGMTFEIIQSLFVVQRTYFQSILVIMLFDSPSSLQDGQITQQGFRGAKKCTLLSIHLLYIENSHTQKYPHRNIRSSYNTLGFPHVCTLVCGLFSSQNPSFISSPLPTEPSGNISGCHLLVAAALLRSVATCCVCAGSLAA